MITVGDGDSDGVIAEADSDGRREFGINGFPGDP